MILLFLLLGSSAVSAIEETGLPGNAAKPDPTASANGGCKNNAAGGERKAEFPPEGRCSAEDGEPKEEEEDPGGLELLQRSQRGSSSEDARKKKHMKLPKSEGEN